MSVIQSLYMQPFFLSLIIASVLCALIIVFFEFFPVKDNRKSKRHKHKRNISRFGGLAMIIAFIATLLMNEFLFFDRNVWALVVGSILILLFGIADDIKPLSWKTQLFSQVAITLLVFIMGVRVDFITNPFGGVFWLVYDNVPILSLLFMIFWVLLIMNAVNWSDGLDGLAGGIVLIASLALAIVSLQPHVMQPPIAIVAMAFSGSILGFLIFNFAPAKIFAGSSGSFFMGFVIAILSIAAGTKIGTTILVLIIPLIDVVWVLWYRIKKGHSIFRGDTMHLHYRLLDYGWSTKQILFFYYALTIICACIALLTHDIGKVVAILILIGGLFMFFATISYEQKETLST